MERRVRTMPGRTAAAPRATVSRRTGIAGLAVLATCFTIYGSTFIWRNSLRLDDGRRAFVLFDDAMITMRYAWNLSHGQGAVWNPGERVEGYTTPLMLLIMAGFTRALDKTSAVLAVQIFGLLTLLAIATASALLADELTVERWPGSRWLVRMLCFALPILNYPLIYWSLMGMETGLLTLLLTLAVLCTVRARRVPTTRSLHWLPHVLALAYLTRPDALLPAGLLIAYLGAALARGQVAGWRLKTLYVAGVLAAYVAAHTAVRLVYYGQWVPNTYVLKMTGLPLAERLADGLGFIRYYFQFNWPLALVALASVVILWSADALLLFGIWSVLVVYQIYVGGDPWLYWRMIAPAMPLLCILGTLATCRAGHRRVPTGSRPRRPAHLRGERAAAPGPAVSLLGAILLVAAVLSCNLIFDEHRRSFLFRKPPFAVPETRKVIQTALAIGDLLTPKARVGVLWAGTIPYYTGLHGVDFLGKCDPFIARLPPDRSGKVSWGGMKSVPGHAKYDLNRSIVQEQPDYIQDYRWGAQNVRAVADQHYVKVRYREAELLLRRQSSNVNWGRLRLNSKRDQASP